MRYGFTYLVYYLRRWGHHAAVGLTSLALALGPVNTMAMPNPFFAAHEVRHGDLSAFSKWTGVLPRYRAERAAGHFCDGQDDCMATRWEKLLTELKGKPAREQIEAVNTFFNALPYVEDNVNYGVEDYWATPYEFMKNGGDCEDYAIAKYISLKRLGIADGSMRIIILQDNNLGGIMHAVLEVRLSGARYLLDNQAQTVTDESAIFHYRPIYAINSSSWWTYQ